MKVTFLLPALLPLILLAGCDSEESNSATAIPDVNFTGVGKPTETVTTQYGTFDIYDPRQDPELLEIADRLWEADAAPDRDIMMLHSIKFSNATTLRMLDCLRAGSGALPFVKRYTIETTIPENCPNPAFGDIELTDCEQAHSKMEQITPIIAFSYAFEASPYLFANPDVRMTNSKDDVLDTLLKGTCG